MGILKTPDIKNLENELPKSSVLLSPSILSADFGRLAEDCRDMQAAGADMLHVDVMDGSFVPNITLGQDITAAIKRAASIPLDVHLMINEPQRHFESFVLAGADIVSFHIEASGEVEANIKKLHSLGVRAGLVVKPKTPASAVLPFLDIVDIVMVMTVEPGFGGQKFMEDMLPKIAELRAASDRVLIEVDGGINNSNIKSVVCAGADIIVSGSALFHGGDYSENISLMRAAAL